MKKYGTSYKLRLVWCFLIIILMISCFVFPVFSKKVVAEENSSNSTLEDYVNDQLGDIDFAGFEQIIEDLNNEQKAIFGDSFTVKLKKILSGEEQINFTSLGSMVLSVFSKDIVEILPLLCSLIAIGILSSIITQTSYSSDKSVADIVHFVCFGVIITIVFSWTSSVIKLTSNTLSLLKTQMEVSFPILLTLMTALGSTISVGVYQPVVAILSGSVMTIFTNIILPLFVFCMVFTVAGNLSNNVKLNGFSKLFMSIFKWTIGITFTLFSSLLVVQGITAGSYDGLSIRTTKYALKSYIPFVGSYLADGLNLILTSSMLIKNSVGLAGLILLFATIIAPIVKILVLKLSLALASSILEPICDKRICDFLGGVSKCLSMLIATICAIGFAYLIITGLIMCSGNLA